MAYPPLALFLACAWAQHDNRIGQITQFLREIEVKYLQGFPGWESYRRATFTKKRLSLFDSVSFSARGLFAGSELLALVIGLARFTADPQMIAVFLFLAAIDVLSILVTVRVLTHRRSRAVEVANG